MLVSDSVEVHRCFPTVRGRLLELDDAWFEKAVRAALERAESYRVVADPGGYWPTVDAQLTVRIEEAALGYTAAALSLEWEVVGTGVFPVLHGELEVGELSEAVTQLDLTMRYETSLVPAGDQRVTYEAAQVAVRAVLARFLGAVESAA